MSFLKNLKGMADDLKKMLPNDAEEKKKDAKRTSNSFYGQQVPQQQYPQHGQQQYGQPQGQYSQPQQYPNHGPPGSNLPPGWQQLYDQNSQRYYYLETATGRSQWEPPVNQDQNRAFSGPPPGPPQQGYGQGYPNQSYGQGVPPVSVAHPGGSQYPVEAPKDAKKKDKGMGKGALLAAGGGGLLAGGLIGHAMGDNGKLPVVELSRTNSGIGNHSTSAPYGGHASHGGAGYGSAGYGPPPPAGYHGDPYAAQNPGLENDPNVSGSDRDSIREARQNLENVQADSDASSSDIEEAREEYQEELEEAQEDAYGSD